MILLDPKTAHRFQPDPGSEIVYLLKVPTVADRPKYRHAVRTAGGKQWTELQMLGALADGVRAILGEPDDQPRRDELLAEIDAYRERMTAFLGEIRAGEIDAESDPVEFLKRVTAEMSPPPMVKEIERVVLEHYPPYAGLVADREVYHEVAGLVAARMFLLGWEGLDAEFRRGRGEVSDDVLNAVPSLHLAQIGAEIERLMEPRTDKVKNSQSHCWFAYRPQVSNGIGTQPENSPSETTGGPVQSSASPN